MSYTQFQTFEEKEKMSADFSKNRGEVIDKIDDLLLITDIHEMDNKIYKNTNVMIKIFKNVQNKLYNNYEIKKDEFETFNYALKFLDTLNIFMTNQQIDAMLKLTVDINRLIHTSNLLENKDEIVHKIKYTEKSIVYYKKKIFKNLYFAETQYLAKEIEKSLNSIIQSYEYSNIFDRKTFKQMQNIFWVFQKRLDEDIKNHLQAIINDLKSINIKSRARKYSSYYDNTYYSSNASYYNNSNYYSSYTHNSKKNDYNNYDYGNYKKIDLVELEDVKTVSHSFFNEDANSNQITNTHEDKKITDQFESYHPIKANQEDITEVKYNSLKNIDESQVQVPNALNCDFDQEASPTPYNQNNPQYLGSNGYYNKHYNTYYKHKDYKYPDYEYGKKTAGNSYDHKNQIHINTVKTYQASSSINPNAEIESGKEQDSSCSPSKKGENKININPIQSTGNDLNSTNYSISTNKNNFTKNSYTSDNNNNNKKDLIYKIVEVTINDETTKLADNLTHCNRKSNNNNKDYNNQALDHQISNKPKNYEQEKCHQHFSLNPPPIIFNKENIETIIVTSDNQKDFKNTNKNINKIRNPKKSKEFYNTNYYSNNNYYEKEEQDQIQANKKNKKYKTGNHMLIEVDYGNVPTTNDNNTLQEKVNKDPSKQDEPGDNINTNVSPHKFEDNAFENQIKKQNYQDFEKSQQVNKMSEKKESFVNQEQADPSNCQKDEIEVIRHYQSDMEYNQDYESGRYSKSNSKYQKNYHYNAYGNSSQKANYKNSSYLTTDKALNELPNANTVHNSNISDFKMQNSRAYGNANTSNFNNNISIANNLMAPNVNDPSLQGNNASNLKYRNKSGCAISGYNHSTYCNYKGNYNQLLKDKPYPEMEENANVIEKNDQNLKIKENNGDGNIDETSKENKKVSNADSIQMQIDNFINSDKASYKNEQNEFTPNKIVNLNNPHNLYLNDFNHNADQTVNNYIIGSSILTNSNHNQIENRNDINNRSNLEANLNELKSMDLKINFQDSSSANAPNNENKETFKKSSIEDASNSITTEVYTVNYNDARFNSNYKANITSKNRNSKIQKNNKYQNNKLSNLASNNNYLSDSHQPSENLNNANLNNYGNEHNNYADIYEKSNAATAKKKNINNNNNNNNKYIRYEKEYESSSTTRDIRNENFQNNENLTIHNENNIDHKLNHQLHLPESHDALNGTDIKSEAEQLVNQSDNNTFTQYNLKNDINPMNNYNPTNFFGNNKGHSNNFNSVNNNKNYNFDNRENGINNNFNYNSKNYNNNINSSNNFVGNKNNSHVKQSKNNFINNSYNFNNKEASNQNQDFLNASNINSNSNYINNYNENNKAKNKKHSSNYENTNSFGNSKIIFDNGQKNNNQTNFMQGIIENNLTQKDVANLDYNSLNSLSKQKNKKGKNNKINFNNKSNTTYSHISNNTNNNKSYLNNTTTTTNNNNNIQLAINFQNHPQNYLLGNINSKIFQNYPNHYNNLVTNNASNLNNPQSNSLNNNKAVKKSTVTYNYNSTNYGLFNQLLGSNLNNNNNLQSNLTNLNQYPAFNQNLTLGYNNMMNNMKILNYMNQINQLNTVNNTNILNNKSTPITTNSNNDLLSKASSNILSTTAPPQSDNKSPEILEYKPICPDNIQNKNKIEVDTVDEIKNNDAVNEEENKSIEKNTDIITNRAQEEIYINSEKIQGAEKIESSVNLNKSSKCKNNNNNLCKFDSFHNINKEIRTIGVFNMDIDKFFQSNANDLNLENITNLQKRENAIDELIELKKAESHPNVTKLTLDKADIKNETNEAANTLLIENKEEKRVENKLECSSENENEIEKEQIINNYYEEEENEIEENESSDSSESIPNEDIEAAFENFQNEVRQIHTLPIPIDDDDDYYNVESDYNEDKRENFTKNNKVIFEDEDMAKTRAKKNNLADNHKINYNSGDIENSEDNNSEYENENDLEIEQGLDKNMLIQKKNLINENLGNENININQVDIATDDVYNKSIMPNTNQIKETKQNINNKSKKEFKSEEENEEKNNLNKEKENDKSKMNNTMNLNNKPNIDTKSKGNHVINNQIFNNFNFYNMHMISNLNMLKNLTGNPNINGNLKIINNNIPINNNLIKKSQLNQNISDAYFPNRAMTKNLREQTKQYTDSIKSIDPDLLKQIKSKLTENTNSQNNPASDSQKPHIIETPASDIINKSEEVNTEVKDNLQLKESKLEETENPDITTCKDKINGDNQESAFVNQSDILTKKETGKEIRTENNSNIISYNNNLEEYYKAQQLYLASLQNQIFNQHTLPNANIPNILSNIQMNLNKNIQLQNFLFSNWANFIFRGRDSNIHKEYLQLKYIEQENPFLISRNIEGFENRILIPIYQKLILNVNKKKGVYFFTFNRYRKLICKVLQNSKILKKVKPYGSLMNNFMIDSGDIDICIVPNCGILEFATYLEKIKEELVSQNIAEHKLTHHTSRYMLLKVLDVQTKFVIDITVHNMLPILNTKLLRLYSIYDQRFHILGLYLKHWSKINKIHGAADNYLSSYALLVMLIHFLQRVVEPRVLPNLQKVENKEIIYEYNQNGENISTNIYFEEDINKIKQIMKKINTDKENTDSASTLLIKFFEYYSYNYDYFEQKISIKADLTENLKNKNDNIAFSIEDPFDAYHNPGKSMTINSAQYNKFMTAMKKEINFILNGEYLKRLDKILAINNPNCAVAAAAAANLNVQMQNQNNGILNQINQNNLIISAKTQPNLQIMQN